MSLRHKKFFSSYWNILDFGLVIISIPQMVLFLLGIEDSELSILLVFRVMRVFKSFRFLRFILGISHIILGIKRAVKTSIFILMSFFVYVFIMRMLSFNLFQNIALEYFGNPLKSMYSIFKVFAVEGWYEIPEYTTSNQDTTNSFFILMYFIGILVSGGILGLSLVNSVFVDAMVSDNNDDINKKIEEMDSKLDEIMKKL
ncbi:MAG: ion transporter [Bacteroidota bacterium]|nr:ion transporter [Bacteroidota bacterium]